MMISWLGVKFQEDSRQNWPEIDSSDAGAAAIYLLTSNTGLNS